jgi:hypothetical protein
VVGKVIQWIREVLRGRNAVALCCEKSHGAAREDRGDLGKARCLGQAAWVVRR